MDQYLARAFPDLTRSRIHGLIEAGHVLADGQPAKPARRLRGGELLVLHVPAPVPAVPVAEELPLALLHEDRDLVVVDKAAGMVVHPGAGHASGTLVNALLHRVKDLAGVGGGGGAPGGAGGFGGGHRGRRGRAADGAGRAGAGVARRAFARVLRHGRAGALHGGGGPVPRPSH